MTIPNFLRILPFAGTILLTACASPDEGRGINDPYEETNRAWHDRNVALDRAVIRPVSNAYGTAVPDPLRRGLSNVSDTLSIPGAVVNDLLQFELGDAVHNTARFAVNATIGLAGLFDPATEMGLEARDADFGETLHRWGVTEGAYVVLPVYGPSTERDALGLAVDVALDPVGSLLGSNERKAKTGLTVAELADTRYRYSDIYESIIYESADSYAQMRLTYLDQRRYELGTPIGSAATGETEGGGSYDIYEDFYE
ncbi:MlaA family lipoprotein [Celeribacter indicus]|uniref:VacJ family lipoprotein n=1 Tax=Celeribacter indicus TaxID=1208324 RepID=A0A0B5DNW5_9RHOB|nr:VacJ family lipoprotein [Celeribacter indicus]AJE45278.1 VacJ family lipoprotein [Celeribacter indicus]